MEECQQQQYNPSTPQHAQLAPAVSGSSSSSSGGSVLYSTMCTKLASLEGTIRSTFNTTFETTDALHLSPAEKQAFANKVLYSLGKEEGFTPLEIR